MGMEPQGPLPGQVDRLLEAMGLGDAEPEKLEKLAPLAPPRRLEGEPKPSLASIQRQQHDQRQQQDEDEFSALASRGAAPRSAWGDGGAQQESSSYWDRHSGEHNDGWGGGNGHDDYWRESEAPAPPEIKMLVRPSTTPATQPIQRGEEGDLDGEQRARKERQARPP